MFNCNEDKIQKLEEEVRDYARRYWATQTVVQVRLEKLGYEPRQIPEHTELVEKK